jgi:uncharacterized SAM-binding protein YcdF (DUF218 family)
VSWLALLAILLGAAGVPAILLCPRHHRRRWGAGVLALLALLVVCGASDDDARRTIQFALMPAGFGWLLAAGLCAACFMLGRRWSGGVLLGMFLLLTIGGNQWVGAQLVAGLEHRIDAQAPAADERFDVICVLGGGANRRFDGAPQLGPTGDRLRTGLRLYRQQHTTLLLATGVFAPDTRRLWEELGVPAEHVLVQPEPENTAQEVALIKRLAEERGWKRIGVVSSAWHLPRVARLAARQGIGLLPLPCDWLGAIPPWTGEIVVPKAAGALLVEIGLKERLGLLLGR